MKDLTAITNPATFLKSVGVEMSPVNKPAQIIPFVHAANVHPVTHAERDAVGEVDIVGNQQCPAIADVDDEALVT